MSNSLLPLDTLAGTIKAHIAAGDKATSKAEEHYKAAGIHLIEARDRVKREGMTFSAFIVGHCNLGRSRAYELIAIADGTKTLEAVRSGANDRKVKHRANTNRPFRNGQPEEDLIVARQNLAGNGEQDEIERLNIQLAAANAEVERLRAENQTLRIEVDRLTDANTAGESDVEAADITIMRDLIGELMESIETVYANEMGASVRTYWKKFYPLFEKIGIDAEERLDKAWPMDDDGNDIDTDYVEPERDELVDQLIEDYRGGHFSQGEPAVAQADLLDIRGAPNFGCAH